jgi:ketosteroid isomerase-like protein
LLGPWGPIEKGSRAVIDTFRWVGSRFVGDPAPVQASVENTVISRSGDLAYTVGFERGTVRVDGGSEQEMVIRVTHIYRLLQTPQAAMLATGRRLGCHDPSCSSTLTASPRTRC